MNKILNRRIKNVDLDHIFIQFQDLYYLSEIILSKNISIPICSISPFKNKFKITARLQTWKVDRVEEKLLVLFPNTTSDVKPVLR